MPIRLLFALALTLPLYAGTTYEYSSLELIPNSSVAFDRAGLGALSITPIVNTDPPPGHRLPQLRIHVRYFVRVHRIDTGTRFAEWS